MSKKYFENLDGWRFIAACSVILAHSPSCLPFQPDLTVTNFLLNFFKGIGGLAVNFFFVLSGFLITYIILQEKENNHFTLKSFYIRRILRIWGVFYIVVLASFILGSILPDNRLQITQVNYFYISTFLANFDVINIIQAGLRENFITNILWSVSVEEQFYLVYPILLIGIPKRQYVKLFIFIIFISLLFRWYNSSSNAVIAFHTLSVASDLIVGCLAAYLVFYKKGFERFFINLNSIVILSVYFLLAILLLVRYRFPPEFLKPFEALIFSGFFAFIILEQNYAAKSPFKIKNIPGLNFLGRFTYGMYCYHMIILILTASWFSEFTDSLNNFFIYILYILTCILLTLGISIVSYYVIEQPLLKLKSKFD